MKLAIFDLDNTLIPGDSETLWGDHLVEQGVLDAGTQRGPRERFDRAYRSGGLDILEYMAFQLEPLAAHELSDLLAWRAEFLHTKIEPVLLPGALRLLERHRAHGHTLLIITAANRFVAAPIAELLGVEHLIATEPEFTEGRFTGRVAGVPSFAEGKVERFEHWMEARSSEPAESWFYSDSHNDLPLLTRVTHPVAVDPDEPLRRHAAAHAWPIISLR